MTRIFKYPLSAEQRQIVHMPAGAKLLSVCWQAESFVLYAEVDPSSALEPRVIRLVTTGEEFNAKGLVYIGSLAEVKGWFSGHFYEQPATGGEPDTLSSRFASDYAELRAAGPPLTDDRRSPLELMPA